MRPDLPGFLQRRAGGHDIVSQQQLVHSDDIPSARIVDTRIALWTKSQRAHSA